MKLKVGDIVRVKEDLVPYTQYGTLLFTPSMEKYKGKEYRVDAVEEFDNTIKLCKVFTTWMTPEMVELVKRPTRKLKPGDLVKIREDLIYGFWYGPVPWGIQAQYTGEIDEIQSIDEEGVIRLKKCKYLYTVQMLELIDDTAFQYRYVEVEDDDE